LITQIDTLYDFALFYPIRKRFAQGKPIREVSQTFAKDWLYPNPNVLTTFPRRSRYAALYERPGATVEGLKLAQA
jgi:hypothetical protein